MTAISTVHASHHNGAAVIDCRGAYLTVHTHAGLTVLTISGEIDASNVEDLCGHARGLVPDCGALIVDLAGIDFIAVDGLRALFALTSECARSDTTWALITSRAVDRLLRVVGGETPLPAVGSATEALLMVRRSNN